MDNKICHFSSLWVQKRQRKRFVYEAGNEVDWLSYWLMMMIVGFLLTQYFIAIHWIRSNLKDFHFPFENLSRNSHFIVKTWWLKHYMQHKNRLRRWIFVPYHIFCDLETRNGSNYINYGRKETIIGFANHIRSACMYRYGPPNEVHSNIWQKHVCKNGYWANIFIIYTDFALVLEKNNQYKNGCIWLPNKCSMLSTFSFFLFIRIIDFNHIRTR